LTLVSHVSRAHCGLLLPACHQGVYARLRRAMEKVGMRGRFRESELVETPPHRAEFWFSTVPVALSPQSPDQVRGGRGTPHRSAIVLAALSSFAFRRRSRQASLARWPS